MISIVRNKTKNALEMHLESKGVSLLTEKLKNLELDGGHVHVYATNDDNGLSTK